MKTSHPMKLLLELSSYLTVGTYYPSLSSSDCLFPSGSVRSAVFAITLSFSVEIERAAFVFLSLVYFTQCPCVVPNEFIYGLLIKTPFGVCAMLPMPILFQWIPQLIPLVGLSLAHQLPRLC